MKIRQFIQDYLHFSKKERIGLIVLIFIILVFAVLPFTNFGLKKENKNDLSAADSSWLQAASNLQESTAKKERYNNNDDETPSYYQNDRSYNDAPAITGKLFAFNPNTLDGDGWAKLGVRERTIRTIINYRSKGGRFRKPDDLKKIYGLQPEEFERLRPFISIPAADNSNSYGAANNYNQPSPSKTYKQEVIDINTADTTAFKTLHGIGSKLAARIVNFRTKLGGFYSISQVGETYGVPDSTFQKIKPYLKINTKDYKRININTATYEALNDHPYISAKLAYAIIKQRKEKGNFTTITAIKDLLTQDQDIFEKMSPYLSVQ